MANRTNTTSVNRFHNLSDAHLADEIGRIDAVLKAVEAEAKALKAEFKARGLTEAVGDAYTVTATDQTTWRLDTKAVREHLGAAVTRFESVATSTVVRIKAANRLPLAAYPLAGDMSRHSELSPAATAEEVARIAAILGIGQSADRAQIAA